MPQLFPAWFNTVARVGWVLLWLALPLGVVAVMAAVRSDYLTGAGLPVAQPVPFSHAHHAGKLRIDCRYCHTTVERSPSAGLPATSVCMSCHSQLWTDADMLAPVRRSAAEGRALRWRRVNDLPDYVYFDHSIHIAKGVPCEHCHGRVDRMPLMAAKQPFFMQFCLDCHRDPGRYLRPREAVTAMGWSAPAGAARSPAEWVAHYNIEVAPLTDCSICHR